MTAKKLRERLHANPFKPFKIHLPGGKQVRVPHPDFMNISPSGRIANVFGPDDESYDVDVFLITALEVEEPTTRRASKS